MVKHVKRIVERKQSSIRHNSYLVKTISVIRPPVVVPPEIPVGPPVAEDVTDNTVVRDFDYAVLRYIWSDNAGKDLDTRTWISTPDRSQNNVGWSRQPNDGDFLKWNSDNTASGVEGILIDIDAIYRTYPNENIISIDMAAFWFNNRGTGDITVEFDTYKGGRMTSSGQYNWTNVGGRQVQKLSLSTNVLTQTNTNVDGETVARLIYDTTLKKGSLIEIT